MNDSTNNLSPAGSIPERRPPISLGRCLVFAFAAFVTLIALFWAVENWRGARAWSAAKRELTARGEPLTMDQLLPPMPPDDQNFAATPLLRDVLNYRPGVPNQGSLWGNPEAFARVHAIGIPEPRLPPSERLAHNRHERNDETPVDGRIDLMAYALGLKFAPRDCPGNLDPALAKRYGCLPPGTKRAKRTNEAEMAASIADPAQDVLDYFQRFAPELEEIAEAARRPRSQFPVHWSENVQALLPHLAPIKQFGTMFSVRAAARLRKQDAEGALVDAITCLRLAKAIESEPLIISQLVTIGEHSIAMKAVWEGLVARQWNTQQVAVVQAELGGFDFQKGMTRALRGERVLQNTFLDHFSQSGQTSIDSLPSSDKDGGLALLLYQWLPGWVRQNQVRVNRYDDIQLAQVTDPRWPASVVGALDKETALMQAGLGKDNPYTILAQLMASNSPKAQAKAAHGQSVNQLAIVACALERFRSDHGAYPKELSELTPAYLSEPRLDPMSRAPFGYERTPEQDAATPGGFKLWSVGLNGQDDGGVTLEKENETHGDWVWPQPVAHRGPRLF